MTVEVIPPQILKEQGIASQGLATPLAYVGVQSGGWGAQGEFLTFRGFQTSTTLWNGFRIEEATPTSFQVNGGVWMENVDRLEVLKGPSSTFYGRAEPGGTVNVVTKKPQRDFHAEVNTGVSSFDGHRLAADMTGALSADKTLLFRLNAAQEEQDSWYRSGPRYESQGFAPALEWRITPQTVLAYEGQYRWLKGNSGQPYVPIDLSSGTLVPVEPKNTLLPGNRAEFEQYRTMFSLDHRFDADWSASLKYMHNDADSPYNGSNFPSFFNFPIVNGSLETFLFTGFNSTRQITDATMFDVTGRFTTAGLKHTIVLGADYYKTRFNQTGGFDFSQTTDYFNPTEPAPVAATDSWNEDKEEASFYVQDQIELPWNWHVVAGGRYQTLQNRSITFFPSLFSPDVLDISYEKEVFLPRAAVLWKFLPWMSTYYSYAEGMGANAGIDRTGRPLEPESSKQHEVGLKAEFLNGRLNATAAVFELTKANVASADPDPAFANFNVSVGEVRSTGFEFNLQGALTDNWNVLFNYSHARPEVIVGTQAGSAFTGTSIVAGQLLPFVSNDTVSIWTSYDLPWEALQGLTIGGGLVWSSAPNPTDGSLIPTQAYTVASAFAAYKTEIAGYKTTLSLNVDNLFDETYLLSQGDDGNAGFGGNVLGGNFGPPRTFRLNLRAEF
ncbi:MAG: TonB-dependent siderophore receptor [Hyphomicrobium sp.]